MYHDITVKIPEILNKRNLVPCLKITYHTDFCIICSHFHFGKKCSPFHFGKMERKKKERKKQQHDFVKPITRIKDVNNTILYVFARIKRFVYT